MAGEGSLGTAVLDLDANLEPLKKGLASAKGLVGGTVGALSGPLKSIGTTVASAAGQAASIAGTAIKTGVLGAAAAFGVLALNVGAGVKSLMRISRINAQTEAAIKSTGSAAGLTAKQIEDMSGKLEDMTATEAESVQQGANMLLTFTGIGKDVFPRALAITNDMARAFDKTGNAEIDMTSQAVMLGKALNVQAGDVSAASMAMSAMKRVGVAFTTDQIDMAKKLIQTGDVMGYQTMILDELQKEFGGSAEAFGKSAKGQWELVKHQFGTFQEMLAGPFMKVAGKVFGKLNEWMRSEKVTTFFQGIADTLDSLFSGNLISAANKFNAAMQGILPPWLLDAFQKLFMAANGFMWVLQSSGDPIDAFKAALFNLLPQETYNKVATFIDKLREFITTTVVPLVVQHLPELKGALIAVGVAFATLAIIGTISGMVAALANPLTLVLGIVALVGAAWAGNWGGMRDKLTEFWAVAQPALQQVGAWLGENIPKAIQTLSNFWSGTLQPALQNIYDLLFVQLMPVWQSLGGLLSDVVGVAVEALAGLWQNVLQPALESIWKFIQDNILPMFGEMSTSIGGVTGAVETVVGWIETLRSKLANLELPDWLERHSPSEFEMTFIGANAALSTLTGAMLPSFDRQLSALSFSPASFGNAFGGGGGDTFNEVNNYDAGSAALTSAIILDRRYQRLNASMGA